MRRSLLRLGLALAIGFLAPRLTPAQILITEFGASNRALLADSDGEFPDWCELFNESDAPVDLAGWGLSDNVGEPGKWLFPAVIIQPGQFLTVFCSGKDRADPAELHTNFALASAGEDLVLTAPDPRVASIYVDFPQQYPDTSFGYAMELDTRILVPFDAPARYFVPDNNDLEETWTGSGFDDASWSQGAMPIGFDRREEPGLTDLIATDIGDVMLGENSAAFVRVPFDLSADDLGRVLRLRSRFDDGVVVYVNGVEVANVNANTSRRYNNRARTERSDTQARVPEAILLPPLGDLVHEGRNVLAIMALNLSRSNDDFLLSVELSSVAVTSVTAVDPKYFEVATPGGPNAAPRDGIAESPTFSRESAAVTEAFQLELSGPEGAEIRYTLNGEEPTRGSDLYAGSIPVDGILTVTARVYQDGLLPSLPVAHSYIFLAANVANVDSDLPLVILNTFGAPVSNNGQWVPAHVHIIEREGDGRARITGSAQYSGPGAMKVRGSSTAGRQKASWSLEIHDEQGEDRDVALLGMPAESDWVLYGAYNFDQALLRNPFAYEVSNQAGRWASHTRFCEVYFNAGRGPVSSTAYWGVYSFMEKIKRGPDRVDVELLEPEDDQEPRITGGYIAKIDRLDPGDVGFSGGGQRMGWVYPKEQEVSRAQSAWATGFFNAMAASLRTPTALDPELGYIDVGAWIDHHIINTYTKNVDAFRLSGYMHLPREGKLAMGPVWDFDRAMGSTDGRDANPRAWANTGGDGGTQYFRFGWFASLFQGPAPDAAGPPPLGNDEWAVLYRARWRELRETVLSNENIAAIIDGMAEETAESWPRNWQKWRQGSTQAAAVGNLRNWLLTRAAWIDSQFVEPPTFSVEGGDFDAPFDLELTTINGVVWYTLDGTDPLGGGGRPTETAIEYTAPIHVASNTLVLARSRVGNSTWSEVTGQSYVFDRLPLVISEIMYNPRDPENPDIRNSDLEFIELQNVGGETISLQGVGLVGRPGFEFSDGSITEVGPGGFVVIAADAEGFRSRYGDAIPVAGEFSPNLSNTAMDIILVGSIDEELLAFRYDDDWQPTTDGEGYSLVVWDPTLPASDERWKTGENWRASAEIDGSPGRADGNSLGVSPAGHRIVGDLDESGTVTVSDAVNLLGFLFRGTPATLPCGDGGIDHAGNRALTDFNGDALVDLADGVALLNFLFLEGAGPALGVGCVEIPDCVSAACP